MIGNFKEYYNLNEHYLKINLTQEKISLTSFNTTLLDGNMYHTEITQEEISKNAKYKNINLKQLYEKIYSLIEKKKFLINNQGNCIVLSLIEGEQFDLNKDLQFILIKSNEQKTDYQNAMRKMIMSLRKENTQIKGELDLLKLDKKAKSTEFVSYPGQIPNQEKNIEEIVKTTLTPDQPNPFIKGGQDKIQNPEKDEKAKKKSLITSSYKDFKPKKSLELNISTLANLNYGSYPAVELSSEPNNIIVGYGGNSYNGIIRKSNEDRIKIVANYKLEKPVKNQKGVEINPNINYFAIYDGHGGNRCSNFLQENLHNYILQSSYFPIYTLKAIKSAYLQAEENFFSIIRDPEGNNITDRSGSCAVSALIMDEWLFVINLGDSRALYSYDSGNKLYQITRDQKPNDPIEKERIEKAGGSIYKDDIVTINGEKVRVNEKTMAPGFSLPYRVVPGNLSVSNIYIINFSF